MSTVKYTTNNENSSRLTSTKSGDRYSVSPSCKERIFEAAKSNIVEILEDLSGEKGVRKGGKYLFNSKAIGREESTPSLNLDPDKGTWHDFGAGQGGGVTDLLKIFGYDTGNFQKYIEYLSGITGIKIEFESEGDRERYEKERLEKAAKKARDTNAIEGYQSQLKANPKALDYLQTRPNQEKWRLGFASSGEFKGRIVIPIEDTGYFTGRVLPDSKDDRKYIHSKGLKKSEMLFGLSHARRAIRKTTEAFAVEGHFDVIAMHQAGLVNSVCILGCKLSQSQFQQLEAERINTLVLCLDADPSGREGMATVVLDRYGAGLDIQVIALPEGDADTYFQNENHNAESLNALRVDGLQWLINQQTTYIDSVSIVAKIIKRIEGTAERSQLVINAVNYLCSKYPDLSQLEVKEGLLGKIGDRSEVGTEAKETVLIDLQELAGKDAKPSVITSELRELGVKHGVDPRTMATLFEEVKKEYQQETLDRPAQQTALQAIASARSAKLDISKVLDGDGGYFARKLEQTAHSMPTNPSWLFTTLVPLLASLISPKQKILIKPKSGYELTTIFRSLIIANTGAKKTPAQSIILKPLWKMEMESAEKFVEDQEQYQQELREYDRLPKDCPEKDTPPTPPKRQRFIISDTTPESVIAIHQENPEGLMSHRDEGSGYYTSQNKYRGGKGDDCELDLSEFNGKPISVDRKSGSAFISTPHISKTGSTQTETFANLMGNFGDAAGYWARWLIDLSPAPPSFISLEDDEDNGFSEDLEGLYQWIIKQASQEITCYGLSIEAKKLWQEFQNELVRKQIETDLPGLANVYPKLETYFGRFCLWLHLTNAALGKRSPEPMISTHTVNQAAMLIRYYEAQWILLHQSNTPDNRSLTEPMLKMHEYALKKGKPLAARDFKSGLYILRKTEPNAIKDLLDSLGSTPGYGVWDGSKYSASRQNVENVDEMLRFSQHTQSLIGHSVEENVENVERKNHFSENNISTPLKDEYSKEFSQHSQQTTASHTQTVLDPVEKTSTKPQQTSTKSTGGRSQEKLVTPPIALPRKEVVSALSNCRKVTEIEKVENLNPTREEIVLALQSYRSWENPKSPNLCVQRLFAMRDRQTQELAIA